MSVELDLDAEMFLALGAFAGGPQSVVSPWHGADTVVSEAVRARLAKVGAVDASGARPQLRPTLAAMAAATGTTTLRFIGTGVLVEYLTWGTRDHSPVGLAGIASTGRLRLEDPAATETVIGAVADLIGRSGRRGLELSLDLPINDTLVLAAIIDLQRCAILGGLATGQPACDEAADLSKLYGALSKPPSYGYSFVDAIQRTCRVQPDRAAAESSESLARLAQQGLVEANSSAVRLAGVCAEVPDHFPAITSVVELTNGSDTGAADVARLGFTCLQAGVTDLLTVEWVESGIHIETVSADTVVGYIEYFVRQPDSARPAVTTPPSEVEQTQTAAASAPRRARWRPVAMTQGRKSRESPRQPTYLVPTGDLADRAAHSTASDPHTVSMTASATAGSTLAWRPTHGVPDGGTPAWATPDARQKPVAHLDPRVELEVLERSGGWARIRCRDGWSAWVNGNTIQTLHAR